MFCHGSTNRRGKIKLSGPLCRQHHAIMKQKLINFSERYATALRTCVTPGSKFALPVAVALGQQAVALGIETLDLARMHEQALNQLNPDAHKRRATPKANKFFTEVNTLIEETHQSARQAEVCLNRMKESLGQRTVELAATNRQLQRGVLRRKVMEEAFEKSGRHHQKCLKESLELQKRLRQLTHQVLAAQEDERKSISQELHDEIAQTLLGINVRLLSLKQEARVNHKGFKSDIASTQRLVAKSAQSVRRVAKEFGSL